jgi:DNA-binding MarR family transcriptional regulator
MRPQSVGELLQKLEDKELITRKASDQDRRIMIIRLTDLGKEEAEKFQKDLILAKSCLQILQMKKKKNGHV